MLNNHQLLNAVHGAWGMVEWEVFYNAYRGKDGRYWEQMTAFRQSGILPAAVRAYCEHMLSRKKAAA